MSFCEKCHMSFCEDPMSHIADSKKILKMQTVLFDINNPVPETKILTIACKIKNKNKINSKKEDNNKYIKSKYKGIKFLFPTLKQPHRIIYLLKKNHISILDKKYKMSFT